MRARVPCACARLTVADGLQCLTLPHTLTDLPPGKGHEIRRVFLRYNVCTCSCIVREGGACDCYVVRMCLTVADGPECFILLHTLADDSPLREHRVGTDAVRVKAASGSQQVIGTDITLVASDSKVPVWKGEQRVAQHVLYIHTHTQCKSPARTIS